MCLVSDFVPQGTLADYIHGVASTSTTQPTSRSASSSSGTQASSARITGFEMAVLTRLARRLELEPAEFVATLEARMVHGSKVGRQAPFGPWSPLCLLLVLLLQRLEPRWQLVRSRLLLHSWVQTWCHHNPHDSFLPRDPCREQRPSCLAPTRARCGVT